MILRMNYDVKIHALGLLFRQDLEQMITTLRPDLAQPAKKAKKANKAAVVEAKPRILLCTPSF